MSNWAKLLNWKGPGNCSKDSWKIIACLFISISWRSSVTSVVVQKIYLKIQSVSRTNIHHDVTDLINQEMVKNIKIWISWEWDNFPRKQKRNINLCPRWHILRNYCLVVEVIFESQRYKVWYRSNQKLLPHSQHAKNLLNS